MSYSINCTQQDNRRHDIQAMEMIQLYENGYSLSRIGKEFFKTRQSVFSLLKSRGVIFRKKLPHKEYVEFNGNKYTIRNHGYLAKTNANRSLMHRDVWKFYNGEIPDGYDIHHLDENKENNSIENLECILKSEHTRLYSPHNNQYTIGRKKVKCGT